MSLLSRQWSTLRRGLINDIAWLDTFVRGRESSAASAWEWCDILGSWAREALLASSAGSCTTSLASTFDFSLGCQPVGNHGQCWQLVLSRRPNE